MEKSLLRKAAKRLKDFQKMQLPRNSGNVQVAALCQGDLYHANYHACHNAVAYTNAPGNIDLIYTQFQEPVVTDEKILRTYYEWLLNWSPFSQVFVTKNVRKFLDDTKTLVVGTDHPGNLVGGALIASRLPTEKYNVGYYVPYLLKTWYRLLELGVQAELAFTIANTFAPPTGDKLIYNPMNYSHVPLHTIPIDLYKSDSNRGYVDKTNIPFTHISFLHSKPQNPTENIRTSKRVLGSSALWIHPKKWEGFNLTQALVDLLDKEFSGRESAKTSNPFAKPVALRQAGGDGKIYPFQEALEVIASYVPTIKGELAWNGK